MGLRSGLIIGVILVITMSGTMIFMDLGGIILERISLGALIIALGMLVDNAIVITEGMLIGLQRGKDRLQAAKEVVSQTALPLLGSTGIAILAFGAIGLSNDRTGEYTRSLFVVLLFALGLSWITAVTITPLFGYVFLKAGEQPSATEAPKDPYAGKLYRSYRSLLLFSLRRRFLSIGVMLLLLVASVVGFRFIESNFFPDSTRAQFMLNVWMPVGTRLAETDRVTEAMRKQIAELQGVTHITTSVGQGTLRFLLTYAPERFDTAYAQFLVDVDDHSLIDGLIEKSEAELAASFPEAMVVGRRFMLGPGEGGRIQIRFSGENQDELRRLAMQAVRVLQEDGGAKGIRLDCREQLPVLRPQFSQAQARLAGITRTDLGKALDATFSGRRIGIYREGEDLLPVVVRAPEAERNDPDFIQDVQVFSPAAGQFLPVRQIVSGFAMEMEDPILMRRNRLPTITVHAEQATGLASTLRNRIVSQIEEIPLPPGYRMEWGGEFEDSSRAQAALASALPTFVLLMVLIVLMLFNSLRITLMIWLVVPLALLGIVVGLLAFGHPFGFMAMLGALSLAGMLIKNSIVLTDEILNLHKAGQEAWSAVVDAAVSRVRPVSMAALTTVLGLVPLIPDVFFGAMAVTIVVGLLFATILTLFVVPVLYVTLFKVTEP
jgi:multidrug efflux pump subunit AcrB